MTVNTGRERSEPGEAFRASRLTLLADFDLLVSDAMVSVPHSVQRVLAFLGLSPAPVGRVRIATSLWPDVDDNRANGDLRSALWRLRRITGVIQEDDGRLSLSPDIAVDVTDMVGLSHVLTTAPGTTDLERVPELVQAHSILPGWDEEWLVVERERYRLSRLRALERSAEELLARRLFPEALDAALAVIDTEPYRESAHRLALRIHIAEGNYAEAISAYRSYRATVAEELGISPSPLMDELVAPFCASSHVR